MGDRDKKMASRTPRRILYLALSLGVVGVGLSIALTRDTSTNDLSPSPPSTSHPEAQPRSICAVGETSGCPSGVDDQGRPWLGAANPKVTIEEFSDYECSPCRRGHREVRALIAEFGDEVRLVHHDYPVDDQCNSAFDRSIHAHACALARTALCAGQQGQFWQMNDALTEQLETTSPAAISIEPLAVELGLDFAKLSACLDSQEAADELRQDVDVGIAAKVPSTPAYLIRTTKMDAMHIGMMPREELLRLLGKNGQ